MFKKTMIFMTRAAGRGVLAAAGLLLVGCATSYQRTGLTGGYSETRLDEHLVRVNFRGNGYTSAEKASDFCVLRCAELTLEHGCRYFEILEEGETVSHSTYTTPTTSYTTGSVSVYGNTAYGSATTTTYGGQTYLSSKPRAVFLIRCSAEKAEGDGAVLDAEFVQSSICAKYGLQLGDQDQEVPVGSGESSNEAVQAGGDSGRR